MSEPLRSRVPGPPPSGRPARRSRSSTSGLSGAALQAHEQAEAEAAVFAVMKREDQKRAQRAALEANKGHRPPPLKAMLLLSLLLFNGYVWLGRPEWMMFNRPSELASAYTESSGRVAVWLQYQRIEGYRHRRGHLPATALQAGSPVAGAHYTPVAPTQYQITAGPPAHPFVFNSTDSVSVLLGRTLLEMGLVTGGVR